MHTYRNISIRKGSIKDLADQNLVMLSDHLVKQVSTLPVRFPHKLKDVSATTNKNRSDATELPSAIATLTDCSETLHIG